MDIVWKCFAQHRVSSMQPPPMEHYMVAMEIACLRFWFHFIEFCLCVLWISVWHGQVASSPAIWRTHKAICRDTAWQRRLRTSTLEMALPCFLAAMSVILISDLALSDFERPSGPPQSGRGVHGQYVYWIAMPAPSPEAISNSRLRCTEGMSRKHFEETIRKAHVDSGVDVLETSTFIGPHADVKPHLNCLIRAQKQVRWKHRSWSCMRNVPTPSPNALRSQHGKRCSKSHL